MSRNGQRQAWWPKCVQPPPPPGKLAAQLKSPFGDSCLICFAITICGFCPCWTVYSLLLFHYYVILPYKVEKTRKMRGHDTM